LVNQAKETLEELKEQWRQDDIEANFAYLLNQLALDVALAPDPLKVKLTNMENHIQK